MDTLGDRIKNNYENRGRFYLTRRTPVIIRLDGKAFHTFTKGCDKPFDKFLMDCMDNATKRLSENIQGFKFAYVQSDEVSILLTDDDNLETEAWYDYNKSKMESVSASMMTAYFNSYFNDAKLAFFDARSFNIPKEEVVNYFLWRAQDWNRNSLSMYCSAFYSHSELMNKRKEDKHEMLHKIGKNWTEDLSGREKNGLFINRENVCSYSIMPKYEEIKNFLGEI
jgi:tRNA(His) 5'-end guanylyltransferase